MTMISSSWIRAWLVVVFLFVLGLTHSRADVRFQLDLWHGYNSFYYADTGLSSTNPAPVTYHRVESPSGLTWRNFGTTNASGRLDVTNNLGAVINECTNGLWKLYLNKGDASEAVYYFSMAITNLTSNVFGTVTMQFPLDGSSGITNQPTFLFTGPTNLPELDLLVRDDAATAVYVTNLTSSVTSWTPPGLLAFGPNSFLPIYRATNYAGITISVPTNNLGAPVAGWAVNNRVQSYIYTSFNVAGGGSPLGEAVDAPQLV